MKDFLYKKSLEDLEKIIYKGKNIYIEPGFRVFHGHHNIYLGSNIFLVDALINAGDTVGKVVIEDYVFFGHGVKILARGHNYKVFNKERQHEIIEKSIYIKEGAWIGSGAIILGGVTIGKHSVVGAGSVVTNDVGDYEIFAGNPARFIKFVDQSKVTFLRKIYRLIIKK